jgi:AraC-like DNA-binding protein
MLVKITTIKGELILQHSYEGNRDDQLSYTMFESVTTTGRCRFEIIITESAIAWKGTYNIPVSFTLECESKEPSLKILTDLITSAISVDKSIQLRCEAGKGQLLLLYYPGPYSLFIPFSSNNRINSTVIETAGQVLNHSVDDSNLKKYLYHKSEELYLLLLQVSKEEKDKPGISPAVIEKLVATGQLIKDNLSKNFTVHELARIAGMNTKYFLEYFQSFFGKTIHQYIVAVKMDAAQRMIKQRSNALHDVALATGYSTPSNFSRAYKKHFGYSPSLTP